MNVIEQIRAITSDSESSLCDLSILLNMVFEQIDGSMADYQGAMEKINCLVMAALRNVTLIEEMRLQIASLTQEGSHE